MQPSWQDPRRFGIPLAPGIAEKASFFLVHTVFECAQYCMSMAAFKMCYREFGWTNI
jgi:hypothetical protein